MTTSHVVGDPRIVQLANQIVHSYQHVVGDRLVDVPLDASDTQIAGFLYELPAVVLSHNGQADPTFTFANLAAQRLFEYSWDEFLTLRSHQSAEPEERTTRAEMLARAARDGYIADYQGVRISASGKRFEIKNAIIWNVSDHQGAKIGQAAVFDDWKYLTE